MTSTSTYTLPTRAQAREAGQIISELLSFALGSSNRVRDIDRAIRGDFNGLYNHEEKALEWLVEHLKRDPEAFINSWTADLVRKYESYCGKHKKPPDAWDHLQTYLQVSQSIRRTGSLTVYEGLKLLKPVISQVYSPTLSKRARELSWEIVKGKSAGRSEVRPTNKVLR